ncbi:hypothetical protein KCP73_02675 [Salmonella enterica subsp. enterica]|nr:hypothetical protein KCP73_02675 [Salmonella enterica subsp. enterica]
MHEEFHSDAFTRRGGEELEMYMVRLWVNLPMKDKMTTRVIKHYPRCYPDRYVAG